MRPLFLQTNHSRYAYYLLQLGSGVALGPAGAQVDTNWRIYFYDGDRDGPGDGGWTYFLDYGYGTSSAINDLANEFTDMTLALSGDSLRVLAGDELLFGATLPTTILDAGSTTIQGVWMVFWPGTDAATGTALFDWIDIAGEDSSGANAVASSLRREFPMADKAAIGDARPVRIGGNRP